MAASFDGMSPYTGMGNNPVMYVDPNGEFLLAFSLKYALIGAGIGGVAGGVIAKTQGENFWKGFGYGAAIGFGVGGFAGSDFAKVNIWGTHSSTGTSMFPNSGGLLRGVENVTAKGGAKFGARAVGKKLLIDNPLLPELPGLPGLDLPVSKLLEFADPYFEPPTSRGVSMVDQQVVFGNSVPNLTPQISTGQNILRNVARYLNVVNSTGQQPQSVSLSGIDTNFANRTYTSTLNQQGTTIIRRHPTSSILQGRLEFVQKELIRLGAPANSVHISSTPNFRYGVNSSQLYFNYGN